MINAVIINDIDTIVTVTKEISANDDITYILNGESLTIKATSNIPINHKAAIKNIKKGDEVLKYGERIGYATADIKVGGHVHTNNLSSKL